MLSNTLRPSDFLYQPYYCEENIWHLCQHESLAGSFVIFIASKAGAFPMLYQRAMRHPSIPVYWDYHVVLLIPSEINQIIDFDTTLPFCRDVRSYFKLSFLDNKMLCEDETPLFKVISADEYVIEFSSDRSHMIIDGIWLAPPPDWKQIGENYTNLAEFIDMENHDIGVVLSYDELLARFS